jgi:alcohol dehydrogenase (quinone), cytochrome c subunit
MRSLFAVIVVILLIVIATVTFALWPTHTRAIVTNDDLSSSALVEEGRYLAVAGDCAACHTAPDGQPFAGGLSIASPIGNIYSTNITPDHDTGIGAYSLDDFDRAIRHGIVRTGGTLYPAMPYPSYARISDHDVSALYAFFLHGVTPVHAQNRPTDIRWPLSSRWPLAIWRKWFAPDPEQLQADGARYNDLVVRRGSYLVQGLGHCGSCHTPRAVTLQEKALDERGADYLSGGPVIDGWSSVNLRGNTADGLGASSLDEIARLLKSARNTSQAVVGSAMGDVITHSTQFMHDDDLTAIATYLKTLPASAKTTATFNADASTATALRSGIAASRGAELYADSCAACHRSDGNGYANVFPKIAGNATALSSNPATLIRLILGGSKLPSTPSAPSPLGMPGFAYRLSDVEVAQLATFIRQSWGNHADAVVESDVRKVRAALHVK